MSLTPMMQQYQEAKQRHPDALLLFRMGDFYELFFEDAEVGARVLQLTLTSRDKQVPMAGFPHHSLEHHLRRLLAAGYRAAICEQVEDPALAKGLVKREVVRVVTAGTITDDALLDPARPNLLVAVVAEGDTAGVSWVDSSTGEWHAADVPLSRLADELARLEAVECLLPEDAPERLLRAVKPLRDGLQATPRPAWTFDPRSSREALHRHFGVRTLEGFGFSDEAPCLRAAGALLQYLGETLKASLGHLRRLQPHRPGDVLVLDAVTRRSLELTRTLREERREGSLLAAVDRTVTALGARLLHDWLLAPLASKDRIEARLDAVAELKGEAAFRGKARDLLGGVLDLARLTSRASTGRASPRDLAAVASTLALLPAVKALLSARKAKLLAELESRLELCADIRGELEKALVEQPPLSPREGGLIRPGCHAELDRLRDLSRGGKEWIAQFQAREIERTGISSLKVGFNKVFGYYLEVTHTHQHKIPADYQRKQTLKGAERYITPDLKQYEDQVLRAEEQSQALEYEIFLGLRDRVAAQAARLLQTAEVLAELDALAGLAELADREGYTRPEIVEASVLELSQGRHPVLAQLLPAGTFVPNDTSLGGEHGTLLLITGPNMSGKSTYIRQAAALTLLAHVGSFVPAERARVGLTDRIFTRVGASDELTRGQSTFMVEMTETANILNNATPRSLVILDEIGRGTSTYDGLAIAWAVVEHLHNAVACRTLFATHYHELTQLAESLAGFRNCNAQVHEENGEVIFLHRIGPGAADRSYGVHVAQLAGVPSPVLERAKAVLHQLENQHESSAAQTRRGRKKRGDERGLFE
jgi:DNA mismatch repair protein MutS